tara:strand:- start:364 stop:753 length:390 start_codon:yes stop_codon:yes gene_type:complete
MQVKSLKLKKFINNNGTLIPFYLKDFKNFKVKRFFILHGKKNSIRGDHAHKKCTQIFIAVNGKINIEINKSKKKRYFLNTKNAKALVVPPLNWCKIHFLEKKSSVLVLCNVKFSENEYIRDYKKFINYT